MKTHIHNRRFRLVAISLLSLMLLVALGAVQTARALEVDRDGIIEADEVIDDDVYIEAGHVVVDGTVNGILIVSAGEAEINGTINGDLILFVSQADIEGDVTGNLFFGGQTLELDGTVEGSVFAGGSSLILGPSAVVERNMAFGGFGLETTEGSTVGRDLRAGGYQAILAGQVDQDVVVETTALKIEGSIGGDVTATVDPPDEGSTFMFQFMRWPGMPEEIAPAGLQVNKDAKIAGTLTYKSFVEQADAIQSSAIGEVVYEHAPITDQPELTPQMRFKHWFVAQLQSLLTLVVLGALVAWRAPDLLTQAADQVRTKPLPAALWGLLGVFLIIPVSLIILMILAIVGVLLIVITLGELSTAVFLGGSSALILTTTLFALFVFYGSRLIVSYLVGKLILGWIAPQAAERPIWPLLLGIMLYVPVTSIPCLGIAIHVVAVCASLGAVWLLIRQPRSAPEPAIEETATKATSESPVEE